MNKYYKLEPITSIIRTKFQTIFISATIVSIGKITVQFIGKSKYTIMIRSRFCPVEYNVLALCKAEYC